MTATTTSPAPDEQERPRSEVWADMAQAAAETYAALAEPGSTFTRDEDAETTLTDLIADLFHLAHRCGLDPAYLTDRARDHFDEEQAEEARAAAQAKPTAQ
jgi:hypothetical protein